MYEHRKQHVRLTHIILFFVCLFILFGMGFGIPRGELDLTLNEQNVIQKMTGQTQNNRLPVLFLTSINPSFLILSKKSLPKRSSMPLFRLWRPETLRTIWISWYFEAYNSTTLPPARFSNARIQRERGTWRQLLDY